MAQTETPGTKAETEKRPPVVTDPPTAVPAGPSPSRAPVLAAPRGSSRPKALASSAKPVYRKVSAARYRFVRAYWTTFRVIGSYMWLSFKGRLWGKPYKERLLPDVHRRNAKRVESTILVLQGVFIKVGQLLSILANFLPEEFRSELEGLQDQVPPRPYSEISRRIESDLGKKVHELFDELDEEPIASASLGQVHKARTKDGQLVAVKVQHHDIDRIVKLDLHTIRRILGIVQWFVPIQGLDGYYHQIKELLGQELDFEREADSVERIAKNFEKDPRVRFPVPVRALSTKRVLTSSFVEGIKLGDVGRMDAAGIDRKDLANRLVRAYCQMIFVDGVYHADPHPGNLMVDAEGNLILLDFGATAELSQSMREGIPEFLEGVIRRDTDRLVKALRKMGFLSRTSDEAMSEKIIEYFHRRFQEEVKLESLNLKDIKIDPQRGLENLLDLRKMNVGLKELSGVFHIPKDWVLLERTILLLYGTCSQVDPELNPIGIIKPYLHEFVLGNRDYGQIALETVREMAMGAVTLPDDLRKFLTKATRGEMEVRVRGVEPGARAVYAVGRQAIYVAIAIAGCFAAMAYDGRGEHSHAVAAYSVAGAAAVLFVLSSIFSRPRG
jgi:predicted unusual protein kinase regulating ubiquinone biosynthesis (AarF/ABC1/UbiB family)